MLVKHIQKRINCSSADCVLSQHQVWAISQRWWFFWPLCLWRAPTAARPGSGWTPSERWSWGRGTCCRWTGACGSRVWTWRWVWPLPVGPPSTSYHEFSRWCLSLCSSTSAWATWSAARGATATLQPKAPPTHAARPAARGKGVATGMACAARAAVAARVRLSSKNWRFY